MFFQEYVFIKYAVVIYVAMCCQSLATLGCTHTLMYNIFVHQSGGRVRQIARARALQAKACTRFQFQNTFISSNRFTKFSTVYFQEHNILVFLLFLILKSFRILVCLQGITLQVSPTSLEYISVFRLVKNVHNALFPSASS